MQSASADRDDVVDGPRHWVWVLECHVYGLSADVAGAVVPGDEGGEHHGVAAWCPVHAGASAVVVVSPAVVPRFGGDDAGLSPPPLPVHGAHAACAQWAVAAVFLACLA